MSEFVSEYVWAVLNRKLELIRLCLLTVSQGRINAVQTFWVGYPVILISRFA